MEDGARQIKQWAKELISFHFQFNLLLFECWLQTLFRFLSLFLFFLHFAMRAKISAITVATGAWLKREEWKREKEEEGETQHGAVQQQLHFQYFCRHPNEVDLLLSRDAIYFSLSLPHSFSHSLSLSHSVSLQRQHHFLLLPMPPFVQILVLYIYKFLTTSSLECNYFSIFFLPFPYSRSQFTSVSVCAERENCLFQHWSLKSSPRRALSRLASSHFFSFR